MAMSVTAILAALSAFWVALDYFGVQPVLSRDFEAAESMTAANLKTLQAQLDKISQTEALLQWQVLNAKLQQNGRLDFNELQQYCALSKALQFVQIPQCGL